MNLTLEEPQRILFGRLQGGGDIYGAVGMGVGKTATVLSHVAERLKSLESIGALVVAPLRVGNLTWPCEIGQWDQLRWLRYANLRTESGKRAFLNGTAHIYNINWDSLPLLVELIKARRGTVPYDIAIFDESTKAKNPRSKRVKAYRMGAPRVQQHIGLTGTPIPNSYLDLFAQIRLIDGGKRLGSNYQQFLDTYFTTTNYGGYPKYTLREGAKEIIEQKIADITVTLKSSDWLDIPDTVIEDVEIPFSKELQQKYKTLEDQLIIELRKDKTINVGSAAALVTKLQQFTSGEMYDDERHHHPIHDLKFEALAKLIKEEKQPVFVACMFKHEYARMKQKFPHSKFFNDAKTIKDQTQLMNDWNAKKIPILFAHPASIGHGLNLQFGSSVLIFISLTYNREYYDQIIARFARRGQTEVTRVYRLMVPGTVDDAVASALESKAANEARLLSALAMLEKLREGK